MGLRLLYVEDDPALRSMLAERLREHPDVGEVATAGTMHEAIALLDRDVHGAILDVRLGPSQVNGFELGLTLRRTIPDLPIVMYSQYPAPRLEDVLPADEQHHWSYIRKRGQFDVDDLVAAVRVTMRGAVRLDVDGGEVPRAGDEVLAQLTARQRTVLALAASGLDARAIADELHLAHITIRRDLSNAYKVLVPDAPRGTDLRTAAVLAYLRATEQVTARA